MQQQAEIDFTSFLSTDEAAVLACLKMNGTKEMRGIYAYADKDGTFSGSVVIGKSKKVTSELK